jgi:hypothetical protein
MFNVNINISMIIFIYSIFFYTEIESIYRSIRKMARNIMELFIYIKRKLVGKEILPSSVFHSRKSVAI